MTKVNPPEETKIDSAAMQKIYDVVSAKITEELVLEATKHVKEAADGLGLALNESQEGTLAKLWLNGYFLGFTGGLYHLIKSAGMETTNLPKEENEDD